MTITKLSLEEIVSKGFTHKLTIPYTDMTGWTSGTAYSIWPSLGTASDADGTGTIAAGSRVSACAVNVSTAFTFAAGTLVAIIGDDGDTDRYFASTTLKTAGYTENTPTTKPYTYGAANTIDIVITCGAGTPATIAAGSVDVFLRIEDLTTV
jgi:hypothetical protein